MQFMKFTREDRLNVELADLGSFLREEGQTGQGRGTETDNFGRHLKPLSNYGGRRGWQLQQN